MLRQRGSLRECTLFLRDRQVTLLAAERCEPIGDAGARAKGYAALVPPTGDEPQETWSVELNFGLGSSHKDAYTHRLNDFGFYDVGGFLAIDQLLRWQLAVARQLGPHLSLVADIASSQRTLNTENCGSGDAQGASDEAPNLELDAADYATASRVTAFGVRFTCHQT